MVSKIRKIDTQSLLTSVEWNGILFYLLALPSKTDIAIYTPFSYLKQKVFFSDTNH